MRDCPKCGWPNLDDVDFCLNPQCRTYLGWASAVTPPQPVVESPVTDAQAATAELQPPTDPPKVPQPVATPAVSQPSQSQAPPASGPPPPVKAQPVAAPADDPRSSPAVLRPTSQVLPPLPAPPVAGSASDGGATVADCPKCGLADPGPVDFCPNPQCRTYLGRASAVAAAQIPVQRAGSDSLPALASPRQLAGLPATDPPAAVPPVGPSLVAPTAVDSSTGEFAAGAAQKRGVRVSMEPDDLTVDPGSQVTTKVTVRNLGTRVEEFELVTQGPGAVFATVIPATLSVYPDVEQRAVVRFVPPRGPESLAGVHTFEVVARSVVHSDVRDVVRGRLTITAFENLQAVLEPDASRGRKSASHQVSVTNGGNTSVSAQVAFADQGKVLTFEPRDKQLALQPGETVDVPVLLNGPLKWFGRTEQLPFTAVVSPAGTQPPITLNGMRLQTAVFPWWIPPAALAVIGLLIALVALFNRPPTVPTIGNEDQLTAIKTLADAGYIPVVQHKTDNNIAQGLAIGTDPQGGTQLAHNQVVKLIMSDGKCQGICPVTIEIPNVIGIQQNDAITRLQQAGIGSRTEQATSDQTAGIVIDTEPKPATPIQNGDVVTLMVSKGPQAPPANSGGAVVPTPSSSTPSSSATSSSATSSSAPSGSTPSSSASGSPPAGGTPPTQVQVPALRGSSVAGATTALEGIGLQAMTASGPVHSNAVPNGRVLSSSPAAASMVNSGSAVTLIVAQNTTLVNLIDTAEKATWTATGTTSEKLTFGKAGATGGLINQRAGSLSTGPGTLDTGPVTTVLETRPPDRGLITGVYQLAAPAVPGDHVKALVGLLNISSGTAGTTATGAVTFSVEANDQTITSVIAKPDTPQTLDADLSTAKGASSIKIVVTSSGQQDANLTPVWQDLQLKPTIGQ